jgi:tRNA pseudouridine55 synthase
MTAAPRARVQRRPVHGVLLLDKPLGPSSNQALQKVKWLLRAEKAGHTGTLDPLASGVLPLCFGAATKFSQLHLDADKTYETVVRLGVQTSTADAEGQVLFRQAVACTAGQVVEVLDRFTGPIRQVPPMHSALKKEGKALYEYARLGHVVERPARDVVIHELDLLEMQLSGETPFLRLRVSCSKGTYIRTLGEDIGQALGCGGHLLSLRRVQTGAFGLSQCFTLEQFEAMNEAERMQTLQPLASLLPGHCRIDLDAENAGRFLSGMRRRGNWPDASQVAVFAPTPSWDGVGRGPAEAANPPQRLPCRSHFAASVMLGTGHVKAGELIPGRLLSPLEIQQILENEPHAQASVA